MALKDLLSDRLIQYLHIITLHVITFGVEGSFIGSVNTVFAYGNFAITCVFK